MKNPFSRNSTEQKENTCKVCKMTFTSKESLEIHRNRAKHFGSVHF